MSAGAGCWRWRKALALPVWCVLAVAAADAGAEGPRCAMPLCREDGSVLNEYFFYIIDVRLTILYDVGNLHLTCPEGVALDAAELPRFRRAVEVDRVKLSACAPPPRGYADALRALNVTASATLELEDVPPQPLLGADALLGLAVGALSLSAATATAPLRPHPSFLRPLAALRDLRLAGVALGAQGLALVPATLRSVVVSGAGLQRVEAAELERLSQLTRLVMREAALRWLDASGAAALRELHVAGPLEGVALGGGVVNVTLEGARSAALRGECAALRGVRVVNVSAALPARWLARCGGVARLVVERAPRAWREDGAELEGALALRELMVRHSALRTLPDRWLRDAPNLTKLDLSRNDLKELPRSLVKGGGQLEVLDLSWNRLDGADGAGGAGWAGALAGVCACGRLHSLALSGNALGEWCGGGGGEGAAYVAPALSPLWRCGALRALRLAGAGLRRVCTDWRDQLRNLTALDLSRNRIEVLQFADLQWSRAEATEVDLRGNPLTSVTYTREDYEATLRRDEPPAPPAAPFATLRLGDTLRCDCRDYWYARALQQRPRHAARLQPARCPGGRALADVPARELACAVPAPECPARCACRVTGADSQLTCERAGLLALPRAPPPLLPVRALLLAHNNISALSPHDIPDHLEVLDLSDNQISSVDVATARALARPGRTVRLAGNPLRCACDALPALRVLAAAGDPLADARCEGLAAGETVAEAAARLEAWCAPALWPPLLGAAALLGASGAVAAWLARPAVRQRVKGFLLAHGLCLRWVLAEARGGGDGEAGGDRDAFLSYSEQDARYAAQVAARLEPTRRLVLHQRDWTPGELIGAQIAASVRRASRTLVLLSEHYAASAWARAELREAHALALRSGAPRLLVVVLPGVDVARAAAELPPLRAHLAAVTYLHWDDAHFWRKLERALPPPILQSRPMSPPP